MGLCSSKKFDHDVITTTTVDTIPTMDKIAYNLISFIIVHKILEVDLTPTILVSIKCTKDLMSFINSTTEKSFLEHAVAVMYPNINRLELSHCIMTYFKARAVA